ncbi:MAG: LPS export ABC transporter periplasmic protein LptC [Hydrogenobaculum sp.]
MQLIISLIVVLFLSIGAFFIYEKEHTNNHFTNSPQVLKEIDIHIYSSKQNQWDIKGDLLMVKGQNITLKNIKATDYPYTITAKEGVINKVSGVGYLKKDVVFSKSDKTTQDKIYTQYTNIDLKNSHFWANNEIIISEDKFVSYGKSFDINLKPSLHIVVYNIKSYEK